MNQSQGSFGFTHNPHPVGGTSVLADYSFGNSDFKVRLSELIVRSHWHSFRVILSWVLKKSKLGTRYIQLKVTKASGKNILMTPSTVDIGLSDDRIKKRTEYRNSIGRQYVPGCLTEQIGGLLLTPNTREEVMDLDKFKSRMEKYPNGTTMPNLATQINSMLPTPSAFDWNTARSPETFERAKQKHAENGVSLQNPLKQMAVNGMLPTPISGDWKGQRRADGTANMLSGKASLGMLPTPSASDVEGAPKRADQISRNESGGWTRTSDTTGTKFGAKLQDVAPILEPTKKKQPQLSPFFVMEMMGFHPQWTLLPFTKND